jgi:hemerythrin superfamily protein
MAADAVAVITNDHRLMEQIFRQLESGTGDRAALLMECAARLTAHSHAEEQQVYPAIAEIDPSEAGEVFEGADEHHKAEMMLLNLQHLDPDGPEFRERLREFTGAVRRHIEHEESEILPALKRAVDRKRLEQLGTAFERVRLDELKIAGMPRDPTLERLSREELYELARKANITGRSHMSKDQLADALRRIKR